MTVDVYDFPRQWYDLVVSQKFNLRSINQAAPLPWSGAGNAIFGPHTQVWACDISFATLSDTMRPDLGPVLQEVGTFFARLRGRAGVVRVANGLRLAPWYDRNLTPTVSTWTDGSRFTDGSGFANGYLPPEIYLYSSAVKGARYIVLAGLPASVTKAVRRGDMLQIKPNGIAGTVPHLYQAMHDGDTDSSGRVGIAIEPGLRQGVSAGDVVGLRYASTLFRMSDDAQFDTEGSGAQMGTIGGSLVEALDLVP